MKNKKLFSFIASVLVMALASCNGITPSGNNTDNTDSNNSTETGSEPGTTDESSEPGGSDKYQVTEAFWTENIAQGKYVENNPNMTLNGVVQDNNDRYNLLIEYDHGNFHVKEGDDNEDEAYFEITSDGKYYLYGYDTESSKWFKFEYPQLMDYAMELKAFFIPIPYSMVTYNATTHSYDLNSMFVSEAIVGLSFKSL